MRTPLCAKKGPLSWGERAFPFSGAELSAVEPQTGCGLAGAVGTVQAPVRFWTDLTMRPKALSFLRLSKADMAAWSDSFLSFM